MIMTCTDSEGLTDTWGLNFIVLPSLVTDEPQTDTLGTTSISLDEDTSTSFDVECVDIVAGYHDLEQSSTVNGTLSIVDSGSQFVIDIGDSNIWISTHTVTYTPNSDYFGSDTISLI